MVAVFFLLDYLATTLRHFLSNEIFGIQYKSEQQLVWVAIKYELVIDFVPKHFGRCEYDNLKVACRVCLIKDPLLILFVTQIALFSSPLRFGDRWF